MLISVNNHAFLISLHYTKHCMFGIVASSFVRIAFGIANSNTTFTGNITLSPETNSQNRTSFFNHKVVLRFQSAIPISVPLLDLYGLL